MATIPGHIARERMEPSRMPRASAWYLSRTGGGLEAAGMAEFGRAMQDVSADVIERIIAKRSKVQELEGEANFEQKYTEFFTDLAKDQNFENYGKKYKKFAKSLRKQIIKKGLTGPARQNLEAYIKTQEVVKEKQVAAAFLRKRKDYNRASVLESVWKFERAGDGDGARSAIKEARDSGFMSAEEAQREMQNVSTSIEVNAGLKLADKNPQLLLDILEWPDLYSEVTGRPGAEAFKHVDPAMKLRLKSLAESGLAKQLRQQTAQLEIQQETDKQKLVDMLDAGTLTYTEIDRSSLDAEDKRRWRGYAKAEDDAALKGEAEPQTDWLTYYSLDEQVTNYQTGALDKNTVRSNILTARQQRKLNKSELKQLIQNLNAEVARENAYWLKEARSYVEEQVREKDPLTGMFTDNAAEIALSAQAKMALDKALEDAARTGKPVSGRDILISAHEIALPLRQEAQVLRKKKAVPKVIGKGLQEGPLADLITDEAIAEAERQARVNLGESATLQEIKAEMLRLLGR